MVIALIIVFVAMLVGLTLLRGDENWDRLIYLLAGYEAIVFAGVGAFFGASVSRGSAVAARGEAVRAQEQAEEARGEATEHMHGNVAGQALAAAVLAQVDVANASGRRDAELLELGLLVERLFPHMGPELEAVRRYRANFAAIDPTESGYQLGDYRNRGPYDE
ncbi:hypothetical protein C6W10_27875 [Plantactinospora sp. BB1]|nr:hypothetical protein C6W10_27875 [Plantactinospora sp. BB1]